MLNKKDELILSMLQKNSKYSSREISGKTGIPITTVHNRIKRMEQEGIIKSYSVSVDKEKIGRAVTAYVHIAVTYTKADGTKLSQEEIARNIRKMPEVEECAIVTGTSDIIIKVSATSINDLHNLVINRLREIDGVLSTLTSIVLKNIES